MDLTILVNSGYGGDQLMPMTLGLEIANSSVSEFRSITIIHDFEGTNFADPLYSTERLQ